MRISHAVGVLFCRWLAALALCGFSLNAAASFPPPSVWGHQYNGNTFSTAAAACQDGLTVWAPNGYTYGPSSYVTGLTCSGLKAGSYTILFNLTSSTACPSGSTLSGGQCTCTAPKVQSATAPYTCDAPNPCAPLTGKSTGSWDFNTGRLEAQGGNTADRYVCEGTGTDGCTIKIDIDFGYVARTGPFSGYWMARGTGAYTGGQCNPSIDGTGLGSDSTTSTDPPGTTEPNVAPSPCPTGTFPGEFNGVSVCAPPAPLAPTITETSTDKSVTTSGPSGTTTTVITENKTTTCTGAGSCTTSVTSVNSSTPSGGTTTTTTSNESGTMGKDQYCAANPSDAACKKDELGPVPEGTIPTATRTLTYAAETPFGGGLCPADKMFTSGMTGQTYKAWNWAQTCEYTVTYIKPMVLLLATFAAFLILMPGKVET